VAAPADRGGCAGSGRAPVATCGVALVAPVTVEPAARRTLGSAVLRGAGRAVRPLPFSCCMARH